MILKIEEFSFIIYVKNVRNAAGNVPHVKLGTNNQPLRSWENSSWSGKHQCIMYSPDLSNKHVALSKTHSLFKNLHKLNLAQEFDDEIQKSLAEGHIRFLSKDEEEKMLSDWHCFSGLTYSIKQSSSTQKIRPCCDSSLNHRSGSLNSKLPLGVNL